MEKTTELRLAWRQEFATALLNELYSVHYSNHPDIIVEFCQSHIMEQAFVFKSMKGLELSVMGYMVKRKLKHKGLTAVITYLEMLEDVFTDCKVSLN